MIRCDVAVAGGGPAGSAVALRLARLGHDVLVVERRPAASRGFAESLAPGVLVHLASLGIALEDAIEAPAKLIEWRGAVERIDEPITVVDRARFDAQLLAAASKAGARVLQPCGIESIERNGSRWTLFAGHTTIDAGFVIDASGRAGVLRAKREAATPRLFATRARWNGIDAPSEMRISALPNGWMWGVRGPERSYHVCTFVRGEDVRRESPLFPFLTTPPDERQSCEATPYVVAEPIGDGMLDRMLVVGDAACAIDPLSSSGVQTALGGGIAASLAVHTILRAPERAGAARAFYTGHVRRVAARHRQWTAAYYAESGAEGPFWPVTSERPTRPHRTSRPGLPSPNAMLALHPEASLVDAPVVIGDFIETRRVVRTPSGEHIAYLGDTEVAPLLAGLRDPMPAADLARSWQLAPHTAVTVLQWLVANEVVGRIDA